MKSLDHRKFLQFSSVQNPVVIIWSDNYNSEMLNECQESNSGLGKIKSITRQQNRVSVEPSWWKKEKMRLLPCILAKALSNPANGKLALDETQWVTNRLSPNLST